MAIITHKKYFLLLISILICCTPSIDDNTIAIIGRQKLPASTFHKQVPKNRFYSFDDSTRILKVENFLKEILIKKEIEKLQISKTPEIKDEMNLWSKKLVVGMLFNKMVVDKLFPENRLRKIYDNYIHERNISVILIPYTNNDNDNIPSRDQVSILAEKIYELSDTVDFNTLQKKYTKTPFRKGQKLGYWTQLFRGIKAVDRELWEYEVGDVCKPIDDGQSIRIIKVNDERIIDRMPPYKYYKDQLIRQVTELWKKPLLVEFGRYTQSLLDSAEFYIDDSRVVKFSEKLMLKTKNKDIIAGLKAMKYDVPIGKFGNIYIDRKWFINIFQEEPNVLAYQLLDRNLAGTFIKGLINTKVNYNAAIKMGIDKSPYYLEQYEDELEIRVRNYYNEIYYFAGLKITEEQLIDFYNKNKDDYIIPAKVLTKLIWFNSDKEAQKHYQQIIDKKLSFEELYEKLKFSQDRSIGAKKEFIDMGSLSDPFRGLFTLKNNEISIPFNRGKKYYIAQVLEQIPPQERSFNEVRLKIQMKLTTEMKEENEIKARKSLINRFNVILNQDLIYSPQVD